MFKKTVVVYFILASLFLVIAVSCNIAGDDCGPFKDKFKTVDVLTDLKHITITNVPGLDIQYGTLDSDTVKFNELGFAMFPIGEYYSLDLSQFNSFSLTPMAFACSQPIPVSEETITDIEVFSNKNFNSEYDSSENLARLFEIFVLYRGSGYQRMDLNEFLTSAPKVPDEMILQLKKAPETKEEMRFTVKYSQNGSVMDSYAFTSDSVVILN